MAIARVNFSAPVAWSDAASDTTFAAPAFNVTTGNTLIVAAWCYATAGQSVTGITDTAGNTYTKVDHVFHATDLYRGEFWYAKNIIGNASNVVTATYSATVAYRAVAVVQYSGLDSTTPFELTAKGTGSSSATTSTFTTTSPDAVHLLISRLGYVGEVWPAGFTGFLGVGNQSPKMAEKIVTTTVISGTYTVTYGGDIFVLFASFKAPASAPTTSNERTQLSVGLG